MIYRQLFILSFDLFFIILATILAGALIGQTEHIVDTYTKATALNTSLVITLFYISGLYDLSKNRTISSTFIRTFTCIIIANIATAASFYLIEAWVLPTHTFIAVSSINLILLPVYRSCLQISTLKKNNKIIVVIGDEGNKDDLQELYFNRKIEHLTPENKNISRIDELTKAECVERIVVSTTNQLNADIISHLLKLKISGLRVNDALSETERIQRRIPITLLKDQWLATESGFSIYSHPYLKRTKRLIDIFTGTIGLALTAPIILIFIALIKMESKGPAIFKQSRVGFMDKEFTLYKLRSMRLDAEKDGPQWADKKDNRVTPIGKFIRKTRIDEFPQFWNIIKGDMSLIGPRPEQPSFAKSLEKQIPFYYLRHSVKPGLSGWAQINYPYGASIEDAQKKLEYELYYIKHMNVILDIKIALKTAGVMIFGQGAR